MEWLNKSRINEARIQRTIQILHVWNNNNGPKINCALKREANHRSRRIMSLLIVLPISINATYSLSLILSASLSLSSSLPFFLVLLVPSSRNIWKRNALAIITIAKGFAQKCIFHDWTLYKLFRWRRWRLLLLLMLPLLAVQQNLTICEQWDCAQHTQKDNSIKICYSIIKEFNAFNNNNLIIHLMLQRRYDMRCSRILPTMKFGIPRVYS